MADGGNFLDALLRGNNASPTSTDVYATKPDLRAVDGVVGSSLAFVPGTGGGFYRWEADVSTPHDNALCIAKSSSRTGAWKLQFNGVIYPEWFGDVVTDATAAIQAAIDYTRPVDGATPIGMQVHLSKRDYPISAPIKVYSGTQLVGEGPASKLVARATFSGAGMIIAGTASGSTTTQLTQFRIANIGFDPGALAAATALWAVNLSNIANVLNGVIDIVHWTACGVNLSSYTQGVKVARIHSYGLCNRLLWIKGNHNEYGRIDKEGPTGSTTDPYVLVEAHSLGNSASHHFDRVLIEGTLSPNKVAFQAVGTIDLTIDDLWVEGTTSGYAVLLDNCRSFRLKGTQTHLTSSSKWRVQNKSWGQAEVVDTDAEAIAWDDLFSVDDTSSVDCLQVYSRSSANPRPIDSGTRIRVGAHISSTLLNTPVTGVSPISRARNSPASNQAVNGSFEAGNYGWGGWGGGAYNATQTFPVTEVGPPNSLMCQFDTFTGASQGIIQARTITAAQVGHPLTMAALVKITGNGFVFAHFEGAGVTLGFLQQVFDDGEWHLISATVLPTSAGTLNFGIGWRSVDAATIVKLDEYCLISGDEGTPGGGSFQQLELGGRSIIFGTAPPTTGTWKRGDKCINSNPIAGAPSGWTCVAGGSPGTWVAEWTTTGQTTFTYAAARTLDCSAFSTHVMSNTLTGDIALTLANGQDGDVIAVVLKQDGTGGRKITGVTVSGRTVVMDSALTTINTAAMLTANAVSTLVARFYTAAGSAYCALSIESEIAAAFT